MPCRRSRCGAPRGSALATRWCSARPSRRGVPTSATALTPGAPEAGSTVKRSLHSRSGKTSSVGRLRPWPAAILLLGALLGVLAGPAWGGTYEVLACAAAPGGVNHSWTARSSSRYLAAYEQCPPSGGPGSGGMIVRNSPQALPRSNPPGATAQQVFRAPPGAAIVAVTWAGFRLRRPDARGLAYDVGLRDEA